MDLQKEEQKSWLLFNKFNGYLQQNNWPFRVEEDKKVYRIVIAVQGKELNFPMELIFEKEGDLAVLTSVLPFEFPLDRRVDGAMGIALVNMFLTNGSFDYDICCGKVIFRLANSFRGLPVPEDAFCEYLLLCAGVSVEQFAGYLQRLASGAEQVDGLYRQLFVK